MEVRLISFSARGCSKAAEISQKLSEAENNGYSCKAYALKKYVRDESTIALNCTLDEWTRQSFAEADALIFVCACGIAVRAVAPYVKHKTQDPAVVVVDELGRYVIPVLSGHMGGANRLATKIAELTGAEAVITTATDINEKFSVDTFAKDKDLHIENMEKAKEISAAILEGEKIGIVCDYSITGRLPEGLEPAANGAQYDKSIYIGRNTAEHQNSLSLIPKMYALGMGCRRGKSCKEIEAAALKAVKDAGISMRDIMAVASVDLKENEAGLKEFCRKYKLKSRFFSPEELAALSGEFSASGFVSEVTGVDNVCERAAVAASKGTLILRKQSMGGVTAAIARRDEKEMKISFE